MRYIFVFLTSLIYTYYVYISDVIKIHKFPEGVRKGNFMTQTMMLELSRTHAGPTKVVHASAEPQTPLSTYGSHCTT